MALLATPAVTDARIVVDAAALRRLLEAVLAHQARSRMLDPELHAAIAALTAGTSSAPPPRSHYTMPEVADELGVSVRTVRRRVADGSLPSVRLGRRVLVPAAALAATSGQERPQAATSGTSPARLGDTRGA